jgi:hypothetical protein
MVGLEVLSGAKKRVFRICVAPSLRNPRLFAIKQGISNGPIRWPLFASSVF